MERLQTTGHHPTSTLYNRDLHLQRPTDALRLMCPLARSLSGENVGYKKTAAKAAVFYGALGLVSEQRIAYLARQFLRLD